MNAYQYHELNEKETIVSHFHIFQLGNNLQDQDYYQIKRQAAKISWNLAIRQRRKNEILKVIMETK